MTAEELRPYYPSLSGRIAALDVGIRAVNLIPVRGRWVRDMPAAALKVAPNGSSEPDPLWTGGYRARHSRYVRRGAFPAYHISDGVTTASAEVFGITPEPAPVLGVPASSRLQLVVEVDVPNVIDLMDDAVLRRLQIHGSDLTQIPDWTALDPLGRPVAYELTQCVGELAFVTGMGGVLYPAARATGGRNLVVFTGNLAHIEGFLRTTNPFTGREHRVP